MKRGLHLVKEAKEYALFNLTIEYHSGNRTRICLDKEK